MRALYITIPCLVLWWIITGEHVPNSKSTNSKNSYSQQETTKQKKNDTIVVFGGGVIFTIVKGDTVRAVPIIDQLKKLKDKQSNGKNNIREIEQYNKIIEQKISPPK